LTAATSLLLIVSVMRAAREHGLPLYHVLPLLPCLLPEALRFALPGAILLSTCNVFGRLSAGNEIVAIKAQGISPWVVIWPALALAIVLSLFAVWLNDEAVCWGHERIEHIAVSEGPDVIYGMLRLHGSFANDRFSVNVKSVEDRTLYGALISFSGAKTAPAFTIIAEQVELRAEPETRTLRLLCRNGSIETPGEWVARFPDTFEHAIGLDDVRNKSRSLAPAWIPLRRIPEEIAAKQAALDRFENYLASKAALQMITGDFAGLTSTEWLAAHEKRRQETNFLFRLAIEPPRRWANGFSCFCFAIVGMPLAIRWRSGDFLSSFFLCFAPILILYYPLLAYGVDAAKRGEIWPQCVWLGNVVIIVVGAWLFRGVFRR
jgi:lipopolysaccharide export system permease protein